MTRLIDKVRPEVLRALDRHCKPNYPTSHRLIITSLQDISHYRDLTIEQVNNLITFFVFSPETLIIAIPEIPGPVDRAYIVIRHFS